MSKRLPGFTRRNVAAYLLDRADQYDTESPSWVGLADAAEAVANGEVEAAVANGEFARDDDIKRRVRLMTKRKAKP